jgi:hypothetical protein
VVVDANVTRIARPALLIALRSDATFRPPMPRGGDGRSSVVSQNLDAD